MLGESFNNKSEKYANIIDGQIGFCENYVKRIEKNKLKFLKK